MATKKVVKKAVKKAVKKLVGDVFDATTGTAVAVPRGTVRVYVNGDERGNVETTGRKLGEFAVSQAQNYGVRTFSVYADGRKVDTSEAGKSLAGITKLEIVAKDARGV